jgi:PKD repeat protein
MKKLLLISLFILLNITSFAKHIKGGWIHYEYKGASVTAGKSDYKVTVYVFRDCTQTGPMPTALGFYDAVTYVNATTISGLTNNSYTLVSQAQKTTFDPCINNNPTICYQIYTYTTTVSLTDNANGYIIAAQDANRVSGIVNIVSSSTTGISFTATIPGTINGTDYHANTSPYFDFKDTVVICYNANFIYQFPASDADNDSLTYAFGNGINGTQALTAPPYSSLNYNSPYTGTSPLGSSVTIDKTTGLISGKAPNTTGEFVIAVYVQEWRNGVLINTTKKELQINVTNCSLTAASLKTSYINCNNYSFTFQNESASAVTSYLWDFGITTSTKDTSTQATPTYVYADTGTYTLKLVVANSGGCKDSATATVKVYPGFTPSFVDSGSCYQNPFAFTDKSFVKYGSIISWSWDFGDASVTTDTSSLQNPSYQYNAGGNYSAMLNITSSKGCTGSYSKVVIVNSKPAIYLPFTDTLICSIDSLPLKVQTNGNIIWTPNYNIINPTTANPITFPKDTTIYTVTVTDKGCVDSAMIKVNVLDFITVKFVSDTNMLAMH